MSLTLRAIAHELENSDWENPHRVKRGTFDPAYRVEDVRIYDGGPLRPTLLYVFDSAMEPHERDLEQFAFIQIGPTKRDNAALALPDDTSAQALLGPLQDVFMRYRSWEQSLDTSVRENEGLQELLDLSTPFLHNHLVVVDPALKLLAHSRDVPCDDPVTIELIAHGYHTEGNIKKFKLNKRFEPWSTKEGFIKNESHEICRYVTVVHSFKTKRSFSLIVVMMCNVLEPDDWLLDSFSLLLRRIEFYAKRDYPEDKPSGNATDMFLRDLVEGRLESDAAIQERCGFIGIPFEKRFCLFCINTDAQSLPAARLIVDLARQAAPAKVMLYQSQAIVLCFNCRSKSCARSCAAGTCPSQEKAMSRRLERLLEHYDALCGRSSGFSRLSQTRTAYLQAHAAATIAQQKTSVPRDFHSSRTLPRIRCFDDCLIEHLAREAAGKGGINLAVQTAGCEILSEILAYDRAHGMDNYLFLFTYLHGERRTSVVANELHMHRNNVNYRVEKLKKTFGIDLSDAALRFDLMTAYRLMDEMGLSPFVQSAQRHSPDCGPSGQ